MFDKFFTHPDSAKVHTRSKTISNLHSSNEFVNSCTLSKCTVNGQEFDLIEPSTARGNEFTQHDGPFTGAPLTEPTRAHQRTLTEQIRSTKHLPPLITRAEHSPTHAFNIQLPSYDLPPQLYERQDWSEQSEQSDQLGHSYQTQTKSLSVLTGSKAPSLTSVENTNKIARWFQGQSEPINISIIPSPNKERSDPLDSLTMPPTTEDRPSGLTQRSTTSPTITANKSGMANRFSFFTNRNSCMIKPLNLSSPKPKDDDLLEIAIHKVIFPPSTPGTPTEPYTTTDYRNSLKRSEALATRLQIALKEAKTALRDLRAENEALTEETQAAQANSQNYKMQLDSMATGYKTELDLLATRIASQDEVMIGLVNKIAITNNELRINEETAFAAQKHKSNEPENTKSTPRRVSADSFNDSALACDTSENSSIVDTTFSSITSATSPTTVSTTPVETDTTTTTTITVKTPLSPSQQAAARLRLATKPAEKPAPKARVCGCCGSGKAAEAWSVVDVLKEENAMLKMRVEGLEEVMNGCLDIIEHMQLK